MKLNQEKRLWQIRGNVINFLENNKISIHFGLNESLENYQSAQEIKEKNLNLSYHAHSILFRFFKELQKGDYVIVYDKERREYFLGEIIGEYQFRGREEEPEHFRKVKWLKGEKIQRDVLSQKAKNSLGGLLTITKVREEVKKEIFAIFDGRKIQKDFNEIEDEAEIDIEENIREKIKEKILKISPEDMEKFIAGVFRGLGYKTRLRGSFTQADGGYDIVASKDGLGLGNETIYIEVKHRQAQMTSADISKLRGSLNGKKGVYFSSGGFSKDAKNNNSMAGDISLIDLEYLVDLIFENYEKFDSETRKFLPLRKIYLLEE